MRLRCSQLIEAACSTNGMLQKVREPFKCRRAHNNNASGQFFCASHQGWMWHPDPSPGRFMLESGPVLKLILHEEVARMTCRAEVHTCPQVMMIFTAMPAISMDTPWQP